MKMFFQSITIDELHQIEKILASEDNCGHPRKEENEENEVVRKWNEPVMQLTSVSLAKSEGEKHTTEWGAFILFDVELEYDNFDYEDERPLIEKILDCIHTTRKN